MIVRWIVLYVTKGVFFTLWERNTEIKNLGDYILDVQFLGREKGTYLPNVNRLYWTKRKVPGFLTFILQINISRGDKTSISEQGEPFKVISPDMGKNWGMVIIRARCCGAQNTKPLTLLGHSGDMPCDQLGRMP